MDVRFAGIVDDDRVVESPPHLQTHIDRPELGETGDGVVVVVSDCVAQCERCSGVLLRRLVGKVCIRLFFRSGIDQTGIRTVALEGGSERFEVAVEDDLRTIAEKTEFLVEFFLSGGEIFVMGVAEHGENTDVGSYDAGEGLHLSRLGDACFDHGKGFISRDHQQREGNADLRIVASRTAEQFYGGWNQLRDPLFDGGFAAAAGDGYYFPGEVVAMVRGQLLQGRHGIVYADESCLRKGCRVEGSFYEKSPYATIVNLFDEVVSVTVSGADRNEQRRVAYRETAAVRYGRIDSPVVTGKHTVANAG